MSHDSISILHVDDDPDFAETTALFIECENDRITAETEPSAEDGLTRLEEEPFDCVVSDYDMPGRNGIELLESVRETYPDLPFILYTGKGSETVASEAVSAGVTDYMQKGTGTDQYTVLANRIENSVTQYRAERKADRTRQRLQELTESTTDCRWMFDREWEELLFVSGYEDIWERPVADLEENPQEFLNSVHPDDRDSVERAMDRISDGGSVDIEYRISRGDGDTGWVWAKGEPVFDDDSRVVRTVGLVRDVTERKERERALRQYEAIVEEMEEGVFLFDEDGTCTFVNETAVSETAYSRDELVGGSISRLAELDMLAEGTELDEYESLLERILAGDRETDTHLIDLSIAGDTRTFDVQLSRVESDAGRLIGAVGVSRDVTEERRRNRELEARTEAIRSAIDGIAILDDDGEYQFVNQAHAYIYGYDTADALVGESWRSCYGDAELDRFDEEILPLVTETGHWRGETVGTRKDGSRFPQELTLSSLDDGRWICVVRDITERKRDERQLRRELDRLDEFASIVSHDLRNPLNVATGRLQLMAEDCDSEHLPAVESALGRIEEIIDDTLALAREGQIVDQTEPIDLASHVETCWGNVETGDADLVVTDDATIHADPARLRSLFENLLRNAVEHGGEAVTVRVGITGPNGIYVEDDGVGIPEAKRDDVFEPGYSTADDGTGLGLSLVEQIAEAHGWTVDVTESAAGGARFSITGVDVS